MPSHALIWLPTLLRNHPTPTCTSPTPLPPPPCGPPSLQERIRELEDENFGDKPWHLLGEVSASRRPLNSALELDMDFETTARPPPAPTEEATASLEEVIKARVREQRWDDVVRVVPPPTQQVGLAALGCAGRWWPPGVRHGWLGEGSRGAGGAAANTAGGFGPSGVSKVMGGDGGPGV
jgi:hypothetical protein